MNIYLCTCDQEVRFYNYIITEILVFGGSFASQKTFQQIFTHWPMPKNWVQISESVLCNYRHF